MGAVKTILGRVLFDPDDPARERFEEARERVHQRVGELEGRSRDLERQSSEARRRNDAFSQLVEGIRGKNQDERD